MSAWVALLNASPASAFAAHMVVENCNNDNSFIPHKGDDLTAVPFHLYRTSTDIRPTYGSVMSNAQSVIHGNTGSGPSCWAYPGARVWRHAPPEGGRGRALLTPTPTPTHPTQTCWMWA